MARLHYVAKNVNDHGTSRVASHFLQCWGELWTCPLADNLIRLKMLQSCADGERDPRGLSLTTSRQLLGTSWLTCAAVGATEALRALGQAVPNSQRVGHRSGRVEPRKNKRRPKLIALLSKPRHQSRAELAAAA